jgi:hypothetical protein
MKNVPCGFCTNRVSEERIISIISVERIRKLVRDSSQRASVASYC